MKALQNHRQMPAGRSEKIKAPYTRRMGKPSTLTSNEVEAANRAEVTALLIQWAIGSTAPEADCYGEDLVVRTPDGGLLPVQLKSPTAHALEGAPIGAPNPVA